MNLVNIERIKDTMKKYEMIWVSRSFEHPQMDDLWDSYNTNANIREQVDALYENTAALRAVENHHGKERVVWVSEKSSNPNHASRMYWEIKTCGYCHHQVVENGYTINQGIFPHMCKACRDKGCKPSMSW